MIEYACDNDLFGDGRQKQKIYNSPQAFIIVQVCYFNLIAQPVYDDLNALKRTANEIFS